MTDYNSKSGTVRRRNQFDRYWLVARPSPRTAFPVYVVKIGYSIWGAGKQTRRASYSSLGIELVTAGNAVFVQGGKRYSVGPGCAFVKHPGCAHSYETGPAGFLHKRFVDMNGPALNVLLDTTGLKAHSCASLPESAAYVRRIKEAVACACRDDPEAALELSVLAYRLVLGVAQCAAVSGYPPVIMDILEFIKKNIGRQLSVDDLSKVTSMSTAQLHRIFEQYTGRSPMRYVRELKMNHAKDLLLYSKKSVKEVAYLLGYDDPFAFSTRFRAIVGISPAAFRKSTPLDYHK